MPKFALTWGKVAGLGLLAMILLAACGGTLSEEDAAASLRSAFEGDLEDANAVFCEAEDLETLVVLPENIVFRDVDCERSGNDQMICTTSFSVDGESHSMQHVFTVEDNQLCGFHIR
ncbi:MAG: hypothetical protein HC915_11365 [Anaerolineae bacterium]|nr:hypothetical protein [Anaerolineae bacterium]